MKKPKKRNIYHINGISAQEMVDKHIQLLKKQSESYEEITNFLDIPCDTPIQNVEVQTKTVQGEDKTMPRRAPLINKYTFLIHKIISRCRRNKIGNYTQLNSKILKATLGSVYVDMLKTLEKLKIISIGTCFVPSEQSRIIELIYDKGVECNTMYVPDLEKYFTKMNDELEKYENIKQDEIIEIMGDKLYNNYENSLKCLRLLHENEAIKYINNHKFYSDKSKEYYKYILDLYRENKFRILNIDSNLRIYSILTQTPRIFKNVLNVKFCCDIHNSHPLLFNKIIFNKYNIQSKLLTHLYAILDNSDIVFSYNVGKQLKSKLIINGIRKEEIAKIPNDIIEYIAKTSVGVFWDDFTEILSDFTWLTRGDIKVTLFREVFYSKSLSTRGKEFAKIFQKHYPNVYKLVLESKKEDRTYLANTMMKIESELFKNILNKLYNKRFKVLTIHDAVVVLNAKGNESCTPELVKKIIKNEYNKYDLYPDTDVEYYSPNNIVEKIDEEKENQIYIQQAMNYYQSILADVNHPNHHQCKGIFEKLDEQIYELVYNSKTNKIMLHLLTPYY